MAETYDIFEKLPGDRLVFVEKAEGLPQAEGDVFGPRFDLKADVFEHHVPLDDTEQATINRHNRAMAAEMLAAAACFRVACDKEAALRQHNVRIFAQRR